MAGNACACRAGYCLGLRILFDQVAASDKTNNAEHNFRSASATYARAAMKVAPLDYYR